MDPIFTNYLPRRPIVKASKSAPELQLESLAPADSYPYIQGNPSSLVLHVDFAVKDPECWKGASLPMPNWQMQPAGGELGQVSYLLKSPVRLVTSASCRPRRFLFALESAFAGRLDGASLSRTWIRNPMHGEILHSEPWSLAELASHVPEIKRLIPIINTGRRIDQRIGDGRNDSLFRSSLALVVRSLHELRGLSQEDIETRIMSTVVAGNSFQDPLPSSEVKSIAYSIARYVAKLSPARCRDTSRGRDGHGQTRHLSVIGGMLQLEPDLPDALPESEVTRRRQIAGRITAKCRADKTCQLFESNFRPGMKASQLAEVTGRSVRTVQRWLQKHRHA